MPPAILVFRNLTNPALDRQVNATLATNTLTTYLALTLDFSTETNLESIVYTPFNVSISTNRGVNTNLESVDLTANKVSFSGNKVVEASFASLSTTTYSASLPPNNRDVKANSVVQAFYTRRGNPVYHTQENTRTITLGQDVSNPLGYFYRVTTSTFDYGNIDNLEIGYGIRAVQFRVTESEGKYFYIFILDTQGPNVTADTAGRAPAGWDITTSLGTVYVPNGIGYPSTWNKIGAASATTGQFTALGSVATDIINPLSVGDTATVTFYI